MSINRIYSEHEQITFTPQNGECPYWIDGSLVSAPTSNTVIATHQCTSGKLTNLIGFYIDTDDILGNRFIIRWKHRGIEHIRTLTTSSLGAVNTEGHMISGRTPADPQSQITMEISNSASIGSNYFAAFLLQEVLLP